MDLLKKNEIVVNTALVQTQLVMLLPLVNILFSQVLKRARGP